MKAVMEKKQKILEETDEKIIELAEKLRVAYKLKKTIRYAGDRDLSVHGESVAEHIFALFFLAQYFLPLEDPDGNLDKLKIYEIIIFHDFGEIPNGDVPYHLKTEADEIREKEDAKTVFESLPQPLNEVGLERWKEYEELSTPEARFVYALDKLEPCFELIDPVNKKSLKRTNHTYEMHVGKKVKATKDFPVMRKFVDAISDHLKKQDAFWKE